MRWPTQRPEAAGSPGGVTASDVRVRLLPRHTHGPYLRRLR
ncbi:hypothetical protein [Streptomyces sp. FIT100]|nr:hypothetical protein [Streptomyces sp. FIT100]